MYEIVTSTKFEKDLKKLKKDSKKYKLIIDCVSLLKAGGMLSIPLKMKPHKLQGIYKDNWECHIQPDLLIIWFQIDEPTKEIRLIRVGSHSELF